MKAAPLPMWPRRGYQQTQAGRLPCSHLHQHRQAVAQAHGPTYETDGPGLWVVCVVCGHAEQAWPEVQA